MVSIAEPSTEVEEWLWPYLMTEECPPLSQDKSVSFREQSFNDSCNTEEGENPHIQQRVSRPTKTVLQRPSTYSILHMNCSAFG